MNRLIIIGNGFDLAHGLKTSYNDFIFDYLKTSVKKCIRNSVRLHRPKVAATVFHKYSDELIEIIANKNFIKSE